MRKMCIFFPQKEKMQFAYSHFAILAIRIFAMHYHLNYTSEYLKYY